MNIRKTTCPATCTWPSVVAGNASLSFTIESCVHGYQIYQDIWNSHVGETLSCVRERGNMNDIFAVAVQKDAKAVGHVPRHISCSCNLFIRRGGLLSCSVTGTRQYSSDLPQGGLEVPCYYMFSGIKDLIVKARDRLEELKVKVSAIKEYCSDNNAAAKSSQHT